MKSFILVALALFNVFSYAKAQNVFDPNDPQVRYDGSQPLGSAKKPDPSLRGLQKWVSTPSNGISSGGGSWDNSSYKAYFLNIVSSTGVPNQMPYRIKFPKSWSNPDSIGKKYPVAVFFHGAGEYGCPDNNGWYNNEKQLVHGGKTFRDRVDNNQYDGFLVYPQDNNPSGCWGTWPGKTSVKYANVFGMIDSLAKYARANIDRVFAYGLSSGGFADWVLAIYYPTRIASIAPSSAVASSSTTNYLPFVHIPVWFASGGKDVDPSPTAAQNQLNKSKAAGGYVRYTLYPEGGHGIWNNHWAEPDFVPFMNAAHKANPIVFFQRDAFCPEDTFSTKIGITQGFYTYEWMKDGVVIARQVGTVKTILDPSSITLFEGNNITVKSYGTYKVRFKRSSSSSAPWSDWSPIPAVIKAKPVTATPPITVDGLQSIVLPAPDGSTKVTLKLADNFYGYQWYRATDNGVVASVQKYSAPPGSYKGKVFEQFGCGTTFSPIFKVVNANGTPKPDAAKNLTAFGASKTSVQLDWSKNPNAGVAETGFEIYRATKAGGPYKLIFITAPNVITYLDNNLPSNTQFFYLVRAVNNTGGAAASNEAMAKTIVDAVSPTAPSDLLYRGSTTESVDLRWTAATDDVGVIRYDIYGNNTKLFSTTNTFATVFGIDALKNYTFYVKAIDAAGNQSPASNQIIGYTHQQGLNYKYYTGNWSSLPNFSSLNPSKTGVTDTVNYAPTIRTVSDRYGLLWEGYIYIPVEGNYTFETNSDDGSKLYIDVPYSFSATPVVNNDGSHGSQYRSGTKQLTEGYHSIAITYFEGTGSPEVMEVLWSCTAANIARELIPKNYFATSGPSLSAPPVPTSLVATATSFNKIKLTWGDVSGESGFDIVRSLTANGTFIPAGNVAQNVTQFIDSNLSAATSYFYKVRALSATGNSAYSGVANANTDALPGAPAAPGTPVINVIGSNAIKITFDDNSSNETGFEIWRSMGDQNSFRKISTLDPSSTTQVVYNDNGLFANVTYFYEVRAIGTGSFSNYSGIGSGTTQNTIPQIEAIPNFTMKYGTTFTLPLNGSDVDADPLTYEATSLPSFATISTNTDGTGSIVFNPSSADQGTYNITAKVNDGRATATAPFVLTVNSNSVPVVTPVSDIYMSEGETLTVPLTTSDVESASQLIWQFQGQPSFATFTKNANGTGTLILQPGYASSGVFNVIFKVSDPNGAWASTPINITVYDKDPNESIQVNFRNFTGGVPSWNDVQLQQTSSASPPEPYFVANNLKNSVGNNTGVSINVVSGIYKASQNGQTTGLDNGVYPDNVIRDQMNWGWGVASNVQDTIVLRVSNLSNQRKYDFTFFGSYQTGSASGVNTFKIGAASVTLLYYQNTKNTATIANVTPDANGQVFITMIGDVSTTRGGVLNALVIKGLFQDGLVPAKATDLTGTVIPNAGIRLNWTDMAYNETNYKVYRGLSATGPWTFINTVGTFKDSTSFLDPNISAFTTYYYYVAAINTFGQAPSSDVISVTTGNVAPVITGLANIYVKTDGFIEKAFTVTDSPGDIVTVTGKNLPSFVKLVSTGGTNYKLTVGPSSDNIGQTKVTVQVNDNQGGVRSQTIVVNVADKFTRSFFVNFGNLGKTAPLPWTNWLGARSASSKVSALKDENQGSSVISLTSITKWTGLTNLGMLAGDLGVYPDSVLQSGIFYNLTGPMQFRYLGLNPAKRYNVIVMSSMNEGLDATVEYAADTQRDTLNASYNTNRTANLNGLIPDASNGITVTMTKVGVAGPIYVNGIVLEEYDPVIIVLNPSNLTAQPIDRTSIELSWSDRSTNENPTTGFELQRATDSLFTQNVVYVSIPRNKRTYTNTGLVTNTKYWYRIRAISGLNSSEYSNRAKAVTLQSIVYVNFNYQLANAASPWNNLEAVPNLPAVFGGLKNQSGTNTGIQLAIENAFNGEFTAGKVTGNNSGVVPDAVLASNFWLDNTQLTTIRISGLNQSKRYRFGFIGSSSANGWTKGDYTATYSIGDHTVYLNSWENSTKIVYINDVVPDVNGDILVTFSTTKAAAYGFNAGMIIGSYDDPTGGDVVQGVTPKSVTGQAQAMEETDKLDNKSVKSYPNPFVDNVNIDFFNSSSSNRISVEMYDINGKIAVKKQFGEIPAGFNTIRLNTKGSINTAGVYILNLSINGKPIKTTKMVKTNK